MQEKNIILVDCFNTIFLRRKSPKDVLYEWAEKLGNKYFIEPAFIIKLFKRYRFKLCKKQFFKNLETEFVFDDVLSLMTEYLKKNISNYPSPHLFNDAKELYIETELENLYLNEKVVKLLKEYKEKQKKIYVVSDFYCQKDVLNKWFESFNISYLFDDIFVSCEFKKTKFSGKLYKEVIKKLNIKRSETLMIGDNRHSDIFNARIRRIKAKHIKTKYEKTTPDLKLKLKFGNNKLIFDEIFSEFGDKYNYSNYAFPLYIFTKRLYEKLKLENKHNVFFLSREGQFLKKLFDRYCEAVKARSYENFDITSHYLLASRNSLQAATLKPLQKETFKYIFKSAWFGLSVRNFLITLTFSDEQITLIEKELNLNIDKVTRNFKNSRSFKKLKECETFKKLYEEKRLEQNKAFKLYLDSFNVNFNEEGLTIVDIGFNGTMQALFSEFFENKVKITGYYIASLKKGSSKSKKFGLLYDKYNKKQLGSSINYHNKHYYEQICRADHSRVDNYAITQGKPTIIFDKKIDDNKAYLEIIAPLQEQIINKFDKIANLDYFALSNIEAEGTKYYYKLVANKTKEDSAWLIKSQDSYHDSFAVIGFSMKNFKRNLRKLGFKLWDLGFLITKYCRAKSLKYKLKK